MCIQIMAEKQVQKNTLSLDDRVKLIDYAKKNPAVGTRRIAEIFRCGRLQVQAILNAKESIIADFETNAPASRKCSRSTGYQDVDDASGIVWSENDLYQCQALCYRQKHYC